MNQQATFENFNLSTWQFLELFDNHCFVVQTIIMASVSTFVDENKLCKNLSLTGAFLETTSPNLEAVILNALSWYQAEQLDWPLVFLSIFNAFSRDNMIFDRKGFSSSSTVGGGPFLTCSGKVISPERYYFRGDRTKAINKSYTQIFLKFLFCFMIDKSWKKNSFFLINLFSLSSFYRSLKIQIFPTWVYTIAFGYLDRLS